MMKNDYRRSLIMLRTHAPGYSGHVRLERRTLMGNLYAVINAPGGEGVLCASLIRPNPRGGYTAVKIGDLRRDGRGQANLAYSFDPRNIDGRTLEDYRLIVIVRRDRLGRCSAVLSGNLNGSFEMDWGSVQAAACAACRENAECEFCLPSVPQRPAAPGEGPAGPQTPALPPQDFPAAPGEGPQELPTPDLPGELPAQEEDGPIELPTPQLPAEADIPAFDLPEEPVQATVESRQTTAAEDLGLDASVPWPGVTEQVRQYFTQQPAKELMLGDGYTYVTAPMPEGSGYTDIEVGLRTEQGVPVAVSYAIPAKFTTEPPEGLENYVWKGGSADGWWTIETDAYTGERLT